MEYQHVVERDRTEVELLLRSSDPLDILDGLLSAAYYDPDWKWVQDQCLAFLNHCDRNVRGLSATCLGHVARIHKQLDVELVIPRLYQLRDDPEVGYLVQDALEDIRLYLKFQ